MALLTTGIDKMVYIWSLGGLILSPLIAMERFFPIRAAAPTNGVIFIPKLINLKVDDSKEVDEFRLYGK